MRPPIGLGRGTFAEKGRPLAPELVEIINGMDASVPLYAKTVIGSIGWREGWSLDFGVRRLAAAFAGLDASQGR